MGKWKLSGAPVIVTYEFFRDGTISVVSDTQSLAGNYKFVDPTTMRCDFVSPKAATIIYKVNLSQTELSITNSKGESATLVRVE